MTRFSVDINTGKVSAQDIDTSKTFSCFHTSSTGAMFAPSVGSPEVFFPQDKMIVNNEILAVDLPSGTYKKLRDTGVMNTPWQGGCVHRGLTEDQRLLHVYRSPKAGSYVYGAHSVNGEVKTDFVQENSAYGLMHSFIYVKE
uniref:Uncharacterized protein n=1 Tax=Percolomonas cosmopolitus TaxID=63605 RepID=A0A7S1PF23_9EUKA|mmetsp:Transcript_10087/g.37597  ORF Transcript_10087/g.37597 Transcript_10087/m.37597 type:complete len:142 (+) Transcript_10087:3-428(+)